MDATGTLTLQLNSNQSVLDSLDVAKTAGYSIALPSAFSEEDRGKVQRDAELFANLLRQYPAETIGIVNRCLTGRARDVRDLATRIGFTEEEFTDQGGGFPWVVVVIAVAAAVLLEHD
jgi:hypothetical protein